MKDTKILIVNTGYYSYRLKFILKNLKYNFKNIKKIDTVSWKNIDNLKKKYNWICASPVETSIGLKVPIKELNMLKRTLQLREKEKFIYKKIKIILTIKSKKKIN